MTDAFIRGQRADQDPDAGFSLIELCFTMVLLGIMMGFAVGPWKGYQESRGHKDAGRETVAALRNAHVSAVAEGVTYRVAVTGSGKALDVFRIPPTGAETKIRTVPVSGGAISLASASFTKSDGSTTTSAFFFSRGSATPGSVSVARPGRDPYVVRVEGLTGRVSFNG